MKNDKKIVRNIVKVCFLKIERFSKIVELPFVFHDFLIEKQMSAKPRSRQTPPPVKIERFGAFCISYSFISINVFSAEINNSLGSGCLNPNEKEIFKIEFEILIKL